MNRSIYKTILLLIAISSIINISCNSTSNSKENVHQDSILQNDTIPSIELIPLSHAKEFPDASLTISTLTSEKIGNDSAKVTIKYDIKNFNLTDQTAHDHHLANSADGQHIHFILNNAPYIALYKPEHSFTIPVNSEHYILSFLSRSFHESIKTKEAYKLIKIKVNANGEITDQTVPTEPSLFYSRPKGEYKGKDAEEVLLDFFIVNTDLSPQGNKIKAVINGNTFIIDNWSPYMIKGFKNGENTVTLSLIDREEKALTGDNVTIERKCNVLE